MATTEEINSVRAGTQTPEDGPEQVPWRNIALGFIGVVLIGIGLGLVVNSVADAVWLTIRLLVIVAVVALFGLVLSEVRRRKRRTARVGATRQAAERGARADKTRRNLAADASRIPVVSVPDLALEPSFVPAGASELFTPTVVAETIQVSIPPPPPAPAPPPPPPAPPSSSGDDAHVARQDVLDAIAPYAPVEPEPAHEPAAPVLVPQVSVIEVPGAAAPTAVFATASLFAPPVGPALPPPAGVVTGLPVLPVAPDAVMPPPPPPPPLPQRVSAPLASPAIPTSAIALDRTRSVVSSVAPVVVFRYRKWVLGQMTPGAVFEPLAIEGGLDDWALLSACGVATLLAWTHEDHDVTHPVEAWVDELLPAHGVRIRDRQLAIDLVLAAALRAGGVEAPQSPHVRSYEPADLVTALASIHVGLLRMYCGLGRIGAERVLADQYGITAGDPGR